MQKRVAPDDGCVKRPDGVQITCSVPVVGRHLRPADRDSQRRVRDRDLLQMSGFEWTRGDVSARSRGCC